MSNVFYFSFDFYSACVRNASHSSAIGWGSATLEVTADAMFPILGKRRGVYLHILRDTR